MQQLLVTEQLIVKPSTWKDSQLLELEKQESVTRSDGPAAQSKSPPTSPNGAQRRGGNFERQLFRLGLDASKTSAFSAGAAAAATGGRRELSLTARTVLGRLPDLAYMLSESLVERSR